MPVMTETIPLASRLNIHVEPVITRIVSLIFCDSRKELKQHLGLMISSSRSLHKKSVTYNTIGPSGWLATRCLHASLPNAGLAYVTQIHKHGSRVKLQSQSEERRQTETTHWEGHWPATEVSSNRTSTRQYETQQDKDTYLSDTVSPSSSSDFCAARIRAGVRRLIRPI